MTAHNPSLRQPHLKPSTRRVLDRLRAADGAWVSGNRLADVGGYRFGGRLYELRQMGYTIERRSAPNGSAVDEYRLVEQPVQQTMDLAS
jgi:biotin operon repressor